MFETIIGYGKSILGYIATADFTGFTLLILIIIIGIVLYRLHGQENTKFFFDQLLVNEEGKASTTKIATLTALLISSWAFVHLTLKSSLTEWYMLSYMSIWVLNNGISKWTDMKKFIDEKNKQQSTTSNDS
jgi:hypothetical protein